MTVADFRNFCGVLAVVVAVLLVFLLGVRFGFEYAYPRAVLEAIQNAGASLSVENALIPHF